MVQITIKRKKSACYSLHRLLRIELSKEMFGNRILDENLKIFSMKKLEKKLEGSDYLGPQQDHSSSHGRNLNRSHVRYTVDKYREDRRCACSSRPDSSDRVGISYWPEQDKSHQTDNNSQLSNCRPVQLDRNDHNIFQEGL